jgi:hypothetical protein
VGKPRRGDLHLALLADLRMHAVLRGRPRHRPGHRTTRRASAGCEGPGMSGSGQYDKVDPAALLLTVVAVNIPLITESGAWARYAQ